MIDLNELTYNKPIISRKAILDEISEYDIYRKYLNKDFKLKEPMSSPFRKDTIPSFGIYYGKDNRLLYNDFVLGGGDCFQFVKYLFNYNSWFEVYSRIAIDFWLDTKYHCSNKLLNNNTITINNNTIISNKIPKNNEIDLGVSVRPFESYDLAYWNQFNINEHILNKYKVFPIKYVMFKSKNKDSIIKCDKYAYVYVEYKDSKHSYKIYQPYSNYKWFGNVNTSIWQGWDQLPAYSDILILTKSLKDVMSIVNTCKIASVSLQSEKIIPKKHVIDSLKKRFKKIYVLYDNDYDKQSNYGQIFSKELCKKFNLTNIFIPDKYKSKDFSELIKKHKINKSINILKKLINK